MSYNSNLPVDNTADIRENFRALKEDKIVDAATAVIADSAAKLTTARKISLEGDATGSTSFDGSADVSIQVDVLSADVSATCTGNSATATKLETARNINGVTFDGTKDIMITQVNGSDITKIDDFSALYNNNGYQKLPGGLILQWGSSNFPTSERTVTTKTVPFPIPFPNACLQVYATAAGHVTSGGWVPVIWVKSLTTSSVDIVGDSNDTKNFTEAPKFNWFAIGY
jgi:hypothetical protein